MEAASNSTAGFIVTIRRDFIPALALMLEQMDLVVSNVRGLSDIELAVRVEVGKDELKKVEDRIKAARVKLNDEFSAFDILGGTRAATDAEQIDKVIAEKVAVEARLAEVKAEQDRRAQIILDADRKLDEQRAAQLEEARVAAEEADREADILVFERRQERDQASTSAFIKSALKRAAATRRIRFAEAREDRAIAVAKGRLEEQSAANTIRLRQATAQTSIRILQVLVGKNKTVAKALFLVEKGLAIARTVQNTAAASVKALAELGPIAGPPAAAAIQAFGAAQIGLIAATALAGVSSVGGGGLSIGGGFGGGGGGSEFNGSGSELDDQASLPQGAAAESQGVIQLIFPSLFGITPEAIDALAEALRDATENRDIVVVSASGRNGELLTGTNG